MLCIETEMHHIAVGNDVVLAFEAEFPRFARAGLAVVRAIVIIPDGFRANEPVFELGMDNAGALRRACPRGHCPGAGFFRSNGEKGDEAEQVVTGADKPVQSRLLETE